MWVAQSPRDDTKVPKFQNHIHRVPLSLFLISVMGLVWHTLQSMTSHFLVIQFPEMMGY